MRVPDPAEGFIVRLGEVSARLALLAEDPVPGGLTEADPTTGERWDAGQVWAHTVEFVPYWVEQFRDVLASESTEPPPFGRVKTDPDRIARIEAGRHDPPAGQFERLSEEISDLKAFLADLTEEDWRGSGVHQTLGVMDLARMVDRFLVGHLEEHTAQLEGLSGEAPPSPPPTG
jgi:hypothetical protein